MRTFITIVIAALSLNAFGQGTSQLPWNPDENGDGLIGVPDLQGLLSQYGLEFNSAVVSDDAESAIVYMGEMAHPVCSQACDNLPGFWHMSTMADLGLVWDEVVAETWINSDKFSINSSNSSSELYVHAFLYYRTNSPTLISSKDPSQTHKCYCAAHELPKVEYKSIIVIATSQEALINEAALEGWRLMPAINGTSNFTNMWRWAE